MLGGGLNVYSQYRNNGGFDNFNWGSFVASTATGALGGGLGTVASRATWRAAGNTWQLSTAGQIAVNSAESAAIGAGVTATQNRLTGECNSVVDAALIGAAFGGLGAGAGAGFGRAIGMIDRNAYMNLPLSYRTLMSSNALHGMPRPSLIPGGAVLGETAGTFISNLPSYQSGGSE